MHRLFVALRPPPEIRETLTGLMGGIEGARWQNDNQLHITLAFIGEVDRHRAEAIVEALDMIRQPPLHLKLGQFGAFDADRPGRTGTLWVGVTSDGPLASLAAAVRSALRRAGASPDQRKFSPHITLARFGAAGVARERLRPWLTETAASAPGLNASWQATEFHLVESTLGREGAHHTPVASYVLG